MALIRYPGSKEKLAAQITAAFPEDFWSPIFAQHNRWEYREPFFGAGAIGFRILERLPAACSAWINDADYGIASLWLQVQSNIDWLVSRIQAYEPNINDYYKFKAEDGRRDLDPAEAGFRKLALHQMSYSGLGAKSGGPLGGREQGKSEYSVGIRWNNSNLIHEAVRLHRIMAKHDNLKITCQDFERLIDDNPRGLLYLDPPYYEKGPDLYQHAFRTVDHERLSARLRQTRNSWILSYDDHSEIRSLYSWASFSEIKVAYSIGFGTSKTKQPKNHEVLITPKPINQVSRSPKGWSQFAVNKQP